MQVSTKVTENNSHLYQQILVIVNTQETGVRAYPMDTVNNALKMEVLSKACSSKGSVKD